MKIQCEFETINELKQFVGMFKQEDDLERFRVKTTKLNEQGAIDTNFKPEVTEKTFEEVLEANIQVIERSEPNEPKKKESSKRKKTEEVKEKSQSEQVIENLEEGRKIREERKERQEAIIAGSTVVNAIGDIHREDKHTEESQSVDRKEESQSVDRKEESQSVDRKEEYSNAMNELKAAYKARGETKKFFDLFSKFKQDNGISLEGKVPEHLYEKAVETLRI